MNDNPFTECVLKKMCRKQAVNATCCLFFEKSVAFKFIICKRPTVKKKKKKKNFPQIIPESRLIFAVDWEIGVWLRSLSFPVGGAVGIYVSSILPDSLLFTFPLLFVVLIDYQSQPGSRVSCQPNPVKTEISIKQSLVLIFILNITNCHISNSSFRPNCSRNYYILSLSFIPLSALLLTT